MFQVVRLLARLICRVLILCNLWESYRASPDGTQEQQVRVCVWQVKWTKLESKMAPINKNASQNGAISGTRPTNK